MRRGPVATTGRRAKVASRASLANLLRRIGLPVVWLAAIGMRIAKAETSPVRIAERGPLASHPSSKIFRPGKTLSGVCPSRHPLKTTPGVLKIGAAVDVTADDRLDDGSPFRMN